MATAPGGPQPRRRGHYLSDDGSNEILRPIWKNTCGAARALSRMSSPSRLETGLRRKGRALRPRPHDLSLRDASRLELGRPPCCPMPVRALPCSASSQTSASPPKPSASSLSPATPSGAPSPLPAKRSCSTIRRPWPFASFSAVSPCRFPSRSPCSARPS